MAWRAWHLDGRLALALALAPCGCLQLDRSSVQFWSGGTRAKFSSFHKSRKTPGWMPQMDLVCT